jgi:hypothetical protein
MVNTELVENMLATLTYDVVVLAETWFTYRISPSFATRRGYKVF